MCNVHVMCFSWIFGWFFVALLKMKHKWISLFCLFSKWCRRWSGIHDGSKFLFDSFKCVRFTASLRAGPSLSWYACLNYPSPLNPNKALHLSQLFFPPVCVHLSQLCDKNYTLLHMLKDLSLLRKYSLLFSFLYTASVLVFLWSVDVDPCNLPIHLSCVLNHNGKGIWLINV